MTGRTNGGSRKAYAALTVVYPVDSVCTCSNGAITLKAVDTNGMYLFLLPCPGEWTVSITDGTKQVSKTISVLKKHYCETVSLSYDPNIYIYNHGFVDGITFSNSSPYAGGYYGGTVNSLEPELSITNSYVAAGQSAGTLATDQPITVPEGVTRLCFNAKSNYTTGAYYGLLSARGDIQRVVSGTTVAVKECTTTEYAILSIDVSALIGQKFYVAIGGSYSSGRTIYANLIYFAP